MYFSNLIAVILTVAFAAAQNTSENPVTGDLGNATTVENNPPGQIYIATLPTKSFFAPDDPRGNIIGSISASANSNGIGVAFQVNFANLPTSGGPFLYHIHVAPVPDSGNCTETLGHLDPFIRGETPSCDEDLPQTCQVGDLSGKHGKITSDPFTASYVDEFASTVDGIGSFFGNRSFVVHFANTTRFTCANFELLGGSSTVSNASSIGNSSTSPTGSGPSPAQFTGAAPAPFVGNAVVALGVVAAFALAL